MRCTPFLIGGATYPICTYLEKNWKTHNLANVDKIKYDSNMNFGRVVRKNALSFLKKKWWILKHFNFKVGRASLITIACYVLHKYCEMWGAPKLKLANEKN
jgi:hypothetical protein